MSRPATRTKNAMAHPGAIVAPSRRKTKEEVAADKEAAARAKRAKAEVKDQQTRRIAKVEMQMKEADEQAEDTRVTRRSAALHAAQPLKRANAFLDVRESVRPPKKQSAKKTSRVSELPSDDFNKASESSALTEIDDSDMDANAQSDAEPEKKVPKGKSKKGSVREAINSLKVNKKPVAEEESTSKQRDLEQRDRGDKRETPAKTKYGKPKFDFSHVARHHIICTNYVNYYCHF